MPGMRDQFAHFYVPDEDVISTAMKTGLVAPDANVLLNLYRFQSTARDELLGALEKLGDRLWIPYQVGLEFHQTRLSVMADQEGYFARTKDDLDKSIKGFGENLQAFKRRLSLDDDHVQEIKDTLVTLGSLVADAVAKAGELNEVRLKDHSADTVLDRVDALFAKENSVGEPMKPEELEAARVEAERRGRDKIPPGYRDKNKNKGDPAGDYIVWRQLMDEAKKQKRTVVFVTDDTKEDWYQREQGQTLGARRELRVEMMDEASVLLLIMTTETFLLHAKTYLNAEVSEETVDQAKELPSVASPDDFGANIRFPLTMEDWPSSVHFTRDRDMADALLARIAAGQMLSTTELTVAMHLLKMHLGSQEMKRRVFQAIYDGQASGKLRREDVSAVVGAMTEEANTLYGGGSLRVRGSANPAPLPPEVLRSLFESALRVSPAHDDPRRVAQAKMHIIRYLDTHLATDAETARSYLWLEEEDDQRRNTQRSGSQEEPPAQD
jgi:hypothetical protein